MIEKYTTLIIVTCFSFFSIISIYIFNIYFTSNIWYNETSYNRCEPSLGNEDNLLREPINSLSSLSFAFIGIYIIGCAIYDYRYFAEIKSMGRPNSLRLNGGICLQPILSFTFGISLIIGAMGSFWYHASAGSPLGGHFDIWAIFVMCNAIIFLIILYLYLTILFNKYPKKINNYISIGCTFLCTCSNIICWEWHKHFWLGSWDKMYVMLIHFISIVLFMFLSLVCIIYYLKIKQRIYPFIWTAVISLIFAIIVWAPEELHNQCIDLYIHLSPLHGLWHILLSITMLCVYMYSRSVGVDVYDNGVGGIYELNEINYYLLKEYSNSNILPE